MINVEFSNSLQKYTNGENNCSLDIKDSHNFASSLLEEYPEINNVIIKNENELMPFILMFIDGEQYTKFPLEFNSNNVSVKFIMAVAGG